MSDGREIRIRVDLDSLECTRTGWRFREPILIPEGRGRRVVRVVIVRPTRLAPIRPTACGFPRASSLPLPGTLAKLWSLARPRAPFCPVSERMEVGEDAIFQVYGHASVSGDEAHDKSLSERRARVGLALLTSDPAALREVADEEGWGLAEAQALLRTLAVDPGPIDGDLGPHTERAITTFAERYDRGILPPSCKGRARIAPRA